MSAGGCLWTPGFDLMDTHKKLATLRPMQEFERRFSAYGGDKDNPEPLTVIQNLQAQRGDHWRIEELFLERWRTAGDLCAYLRWAAEQIESLAKKTIKKKD